MNGINISILRSMAYTISDIKPDNTLVCLPNTENIIDKILKEDPSTTYDSRIEPSLSPDPIITVKSQPISIDASEIDLFSVDIRIVDFGHGECSTE